MDENEVIARYVRWAVIENIATLIAMILGCWLVSGWFCLLILNMNSFKPKPNPKQKP